jgi:Complex I intermediate-associated protein 30 (CIA30)
MLTAILLLITNTTTTQLRSPIELQEYEGVVMKVRSDGRVYAVNLEPQSYFDGDLYQGYIIAPPGRWTEVTFPFDGLALTSKVKRKSKARVIFRLMLVLVNWGLPHLTQTNTLVSVCVCIYDTQGFCV